MKKGFVVLLIMEIMLLWLSELEESTFSSFSGYDPLLGMNQNVTESTKGVSKSFEHSDIWNKQRLQEEITFIFRKKMNKYTLQ